MLAEGKLSQAEIAEKLGVTLQTIGYYSNGSSDGNWLYDEVERRSSRLHLEVVMTHAFRDADMFFPDGRIDMDPIKKALEEELELLRRGTRGIYGDDLRREVRKTFGNNEGSQDG